jgi:uncharacterized integral membrane protein (TIGR00698 family)
VELAPGLGLCLAIAAAATALATVVPLGSAPVIGIVLGLLAGVVLKPTPAMRAGIKPATALPLRAAVIALGAEVPLGTVLRQGGHSIAGIVVTVGGCLVAARLLGRRLAVPDRLRTLIGVGTAICGASAIAAASPVVEADDTEIGYAVTTIFVFNVAAVFCFPALGHLLGLGQRGFGVFSGSAVNDLSSVVAAANLYGAGALHTAVIVKLTRTLMIVPICAVLARRRPVQPGASRPRVTVPMFLLGFLALAALNGAGAIPADWHGAISVTATALITVALSAVGLSVNVGALRRTGVRPIAFGASLWLIVTSLSLGCQAAGLL